MPYIPRSLARPALACLVAALLLGLAACAGKPPVRRTPDAQAGTPAQDIQTKADQAYEAGDHAQSEVLNRRLLDKGGLSEEQQATAWTRLAASALKNGHPQVCLEALDNLARLRPEARDQWDWNALYIAATMRSGRPDAARTHLADILRDPVRPWDLRFRAGLSLARDLWGERRYEDAMHVLGRLYAESPEPSPMSRGQLEAGLLAELQTVDDATLGELSRLTPIASQWTFPYTIVRLETARRIAKRDGGWTQAWRLLSGLMQHGEMADRTLVGDVLTPLRQRLGVPTSGIVLALPLSGPYAEIGWNVLRGAGAAQWEILSAGGQMHIRTVNTEAPGWLGEVDAAPAGFTLMGGPLRLDRFQALQASGKLGLRPVFAFLPRLDGAVEGRDAWRLFPSPEDQVRSLLQLASGSLGIDSFAVLSPDESFGRRYAQAFENEAALWNCSVNATGSYPPGEPTSWSRTVASLLGVDPAEGKDERTPPEPPFSAVFLPDGWSQAKLLAPQFFFYDEDRLLLLGPAAWGQGLARDENVETNYFRLAAFPGAWWPDNPAPGTEALRRAMDTDGLGAPDFWTALGYDFVRLAQTLPPLPAAWTPGAVNDALQVAGDVPWSMAPVAWGEMGQARQEMFLFQPSGDGYEILDPARLGLRLERTRTRHAERVQAQQDKRELESLRKMQQADPENADVNARLNDLLRRLEDERGIQPPQPKPQLLTQPPQPGAEAPAQPATQQ